MLQSSIPGQAEILAELSLLMPLGNVQGTAVTQLVAVVGTSLQHCISIFLRQSTTFIWYLFSCSDLHQSWEGFSSFCCPSPPFCAQKAPSLHACPVLAGRGAPCCSFLLRTWVCQFITMLAELSIDFWFIDPSGCACRFSCPNQIPV